MRWRAGCRQSHCKPTTTDQVQKIRLYDSWKKNLDKEIQIATGREREGDWWQNKKNNNNIILNYYMYRKLYWKHFTIHAITTCVSIYLISCDAKLSVYLFWVVYPGDIL